MFQIAQAAHCFRDIAILKQANSRDSGGARSQASLGVHQSDTA